MSCKDAHLAEQPPSNHRRSSNRFYSNEVLELKALGWDNDTIKLELWTNPEEEWR
jgi:hypothetical protein